MSLASSFHLSGTTATVIPAESRTRGLQERADLFHALLLLPRLECARDDPVRCDEREYGAHALAKPRRRHPVQEERDRQRGERKDREQVARFVGIAARQRPVGEHHRKDPRRDREHQSEPLPAFEGPARFGVRPPIHERDRQRGEGLRRAPRAGSSDPRG